MSIHLIRIRHFQQSSFRLNHRLPWDETHPKVMQRTANFHHQIADAHLPEAVGVVHDTTAFDAAVDVLDTHATARDAPVGGFLRPCESPAPRLLGGHDDLDVVEREGQETEILEQPAACGQGVRRGICNRVHYVILTERRPQVSEGPSFCRPRRRSQRFRCRWHSARLTCSWPARYTTRLLNASAAHD